MIVPCKALRAGQGDPREGDPRHGGVRQHHHAQVAIFVTTSRFTRPAQSLCTEHDIWALHRDLLGLWNNGASLLSFPQGNAGHCDRQRQARWKRTYDK